MNLAVIKEIDKKYDEAVELYEQDINIVGQLESFVNLAFLYWSFAFEIFEFNVPNNILEEWSNIGGNRYPKILELGLKQYPNSAELHFWKKYFQHIIFGEDFTEQGCKELLEKYREDNSIVPYFFLYLFNNDKLKTVKVGGSIKGKDLNFLDKNASKVIESITRESETKFSIQRKTGAGLVGIKSDAYIEIYQNKSISGKYFDNGNKTINGILIKTHGLPAVEIGNSEVTSFLIRGNYGYYRVNKTTISSFSLKD